VTLVGHPLLFGGQTPLNRPLAKHRAAEAPASWPFHSRQPGAAEADRPGDWGGLPSFAPACHFLGIVSEQIPLAYLSVSFQLGFGTIEIERKRPPKTPRSTLEFRSPMLPERLELLLGGSLFAGRLFWAPADAVAHGPAGGGAAALPPAW